LLPRASHHRAATSLSSLLKNGGKLRARLSLKIIFAAQQASEFAVAPRRPLMGDYLLAS
jgi:hypothetical protein